MGTPARSGYVYRSELRDVEVRTLEEGNELRTEYVTPLGTVSTLARRSEILERGGIVGWREVEHVIKGPADYQAVEYLIEHTDVVPTYDAYMAYEEDVGEDGVPIVPGGTDPMYRILRELIGYKDAFLHLHDMPDRVLHLRDVLEEQAAQIEQIVLDSPATLILQGEHFDSQMTPPPFFEKYMMPHFRSFADRLHERGKVLACHADADTSLLLGLIKESGFDMAECFVTAPMVPVTLSEAREAWGDEIVIWGGIPSVMLSEPVSDEAFRQYLAELFRTIAPGDAFILGVADNVMAESKLERIEWVSELIRQHSEYPLDRTRFEQIGGGFSQ